MSSSVNLGYKNRPLRVVFFVDPDNRRTAEYIKSIIEFNSKVWGGRYNPIIPIKDGKKVLLGYEELLNAYDPDVIFSLVKLDKKFTEKLDKIISPIAIQDWRPRGRRRNKLVVEHELKQYLVDLEPIVKKLTEKITQGESHFWNPPNLVVTNVNEQSKYYDFFLFNFGRYAKDLSQRRNQDGLPTLEVKSSERFNTSIKKLATRRQELLTAHHMTLHDVRLPFDNENHQDDIQVFIGNSNWDTILYWNNIFFAPEYKHQRCFQLYIPEFLLKKSDSAELLAKFINVSLYSNSNPREVIFSSVTLTALELNRYIENLRNFFITRPILRPNKVNKRGVQHPAVKTRDVRRKISGHYNELHTIEDIPVKIEPPDFMLKPPNGEFRGTAKVWMTDFFIQYRPEKFNFTNQSYFWLLPKQTEITSAFASSYLGRVINTGEISLMLSQENNVIPLKMPDDSTIFHYLITYGGRYGYTDDIRKSKKKYYQEIGLSDKGYLLYGTLKLFNGLYEFGQTIENRYWRSIFEQLSIDPKESNQRVSVKNKVKKLLRNHKSESLENSIVDYVFDAQKILKETKGKISFSILLDKLTDERQKFAAKQGNGHSFPHDVKTNKNDLLEALESLIERNIFQQGIEIACNLCGVKYWHSIDEVSQHFPCRGCGQKNQIPPESKWIYKLNPLISHAIGRQGTSAVLWTLYELLMHRSKFNFIFLPSLNLYKNHDDKKPDREIDFACIIDGEFVIGEVKKSATLFKKKDIDCLIKIAKRIPISRIILASLDKGSLASEKHLLEEKLKTRGVTVEIMQPNQFFFDETYHIGFGGKIFKIGF